MMFTAFVLHLGSGNGVTRPSWHQTMMCTHEHVDVQLGRHPPGWVARAMSQHRDGECWDQADELGGGD